MVTRRDIFIKSRYIVLVVWFSVLCAGLTGTYFYYLSAIDNIRDHEYIELSAVGHTRSELIRNWRRERLGDIQVISTEPLIRNQLVGLTAENNEKGFQADALEALEVFLKAYGYSEGLVVSLGHRILVSTDRDTESLNPVEKNTIQEVIKTDAATLGELYRNSKGLVMMCAAAPVRDLAGRPVCIVVLKIDAQRSLFPLLEFWPTPSTTAESIIAGRDGQEIVALSEFRHKPDLALSFSRPITDTHLPAVQAALGKVGMFHGEDYRGMGVLADLRRIPQSNWFMVTKIDMDEILAQARSRSIVMAIFCLMAATMIGVAIAFLSRRRQSRLYEDLYHSERLQREAQEEFRVTLYSIGDAVITTDRNGTVKRMNHVAELLTGWSESEGQGKPLEEVFHIVNELSRKPVDTPVERVLQTGKLVGLANHTMLIARDGSECPITDSAAPITEKTGSIIGVVLVFRYQTRERAVLDRLRSSQERLTIIADHIYDWEYWLNPDNKLEYCSPSCLRVTGYPPDEFIEDPQLLRKIVHPDDLTIYDRHIENVQNQTDAGFCELDYRIITRSGDVVWLSHCCTPVYSRDGAPLGRRISNRDVTERKQVEEERSISLERQKLVNQLQQSLLGPGPLLPKLKKITDCIMNIFDADFCRIWRIVPGDLCENGCIHCEITDVRHACLDRKRCLKLEASSGRYTHTDGEKHRRVPFGAYKIGRVASGVENRFLTNDVLNDPRIHDNQWAQELGLVSFAGYQLSQPDGERLGVLALFSKHPISPEEDAQLEALSNTVARVIYSSMIEESLSDSEKRFRIAFMTNPDAVTLSRIDESNQGFYVDVNDGFCDLTGYTPEEVIRKSTSDLGLWSDPADRERLLAGLRERGEVTNLETRIRLKDGRTKVALLSARVIKLGGTPHVLAVTRDIDYWKKAEDALKTSEERFRQVAELAGDWIWEVDKDGMFTYSSSVVFQALGYHPDELVGKRLFWDTLDPEGFENSALSTKEHFSRKQWFKGYVTYHLHKHGHSVIMETSGAPVLDDQGAFQGYRGTNTDITARVRASESQELLAAVVEHAAESIVVTDTSGAIKYVNPAFQQRCGYSREEAIGANPRILKSGRQSDAFYARLWETIKGGEVWSGHFVNRKKDGSLFEEDATISPLRDANGRIANFVAVKRDVTKEMSLQNQLAQSQKMEAIGTLAGGIAHDFNNVLSAIIGYTELAIDDQPEGSRSARNLGQVLAAAKRAADMVKQILTFSRQSEPQRRLLDLAPIVKEGLKFLRNSIPATIEIRQSVGSSLGKVEADPTQMHQVLMNLCANAAQAIKDTTGTVTVELSSITLDEDYSARHLSLNPGRYLKLSVSDTGEGITEENIDRIFEPYFTTKGVGEGTGLGLAVIHGIVESHGGSISVYSVPGHGSTFNVLLPVAESQAEPEGSQDSNLTPSGNERILLVDDEESLVEMGQAMLKRLGYYVVASMDPQEALDIFRADPSGFDLVITDLMMPGMTGLDLAKEIKELKPDAAIILCTGFGHKFTEEDAEAQGLSGIISKPITKRVLSQMVRNVLNEKLNLTHDDSMT